MNEPDDRQLVAQTLSGETAAYEQLVVRHSTSVYSVGMSMLRNPIDAQDIVQDTFLRAFRKLDTYRGDASFRSWLLRIAANNCLMKLRSRRRRPEVSLEVESVDFDARGHMLGRIPNFAPRMDEAYERKEMRALMYEAMEQLPDKYRAVFVLADLHDLTMREIADSLSLTVPNVKTRLHRARLKLRESLQRRLADDENL